MATPDNNKNSGACHAVAGIARGVLNGSIGIVEGSRMLSTIRHAAGADDDADFLFFVGVDSETDHLPVGDVRRHLSPDALRVKDEELREFEAQVRGRALEVRRKLIERYDHAA